MLCSKEATPVAIGKKEKLLLGEVSEPPTRMAAHPATGRNTHGSTMRVAP